VDEISLLEVLSISAEDLVERFKDRIEERYDQLSRDFDDEEED
jgi:ribosome assembly protein YihI (activator of Der GTPase)